MRPTIARLVASSPRLGLLVGLTLLGGWLRFSAINFGLPDQLRPDEEKIVPRALDFEDDWNPHLAIYPAAQTYLTHAVLRSYAILTGAGHDLSAAYHSDNQAQAYLIGRYLAGAMGTATIPVIYLAGATVSGPAAGIMSAAIMAVTFLHVRDSKFVKVEVPAGFWLALSILMMLRISVRARSSDYCMAGVFCGLAAATHYTSGAISVGIFVAHLEACRRAGKPFIDSLRDRKIYLAGLAAIGAFSCANPYFFLDWTQTKSDYLLLHEYYLHFTHGQGPYDYGWRWLILRAMPAGVGVELEIFLLVALVWMAIRPRPGTYALLAFVLVCLLSLISGHPWLEVRYLINPLVAMALIGGIMAADIIAIAGSWKGPRLGFLATVSMLLLLAPSVIRDVQLNKLLNQTDTRTIARIWMQRHIPPGATVIMLGGDTWGKPKIPGWYKVVSTDSIVSLQDTLKTATWVVSDTFPPLRQWSSDLSDSQETILLANGTLEFDIDPVKPNAEPPECELNDGFYVPFANITSVSRPGPRIRIWKIDSPR
jgi:dolichyl-phosphate-mannose-protein mannosyltransferase